MDANVEKLKSMAPPNGMDFHIGKLGHRDGCQTAVQFRDPDSHSLGWGFDQVDSDERVCHSNEWPAVKLLEETIAHPVPGHDAYIPR